MNVLPEKPVVPSKWKTSAWIAIVVIIVVIGLSLVGLVAYGKSYDQRVLPGVRIGDVPVGGMSADELGDFLESMNSKLASEGIQIMTEDGSISFVMYPPIVPDSNIYELLLIETDKEVERFLSYRKQGGAFSQGLQSIRTRLGSPSLQLEYIIADTEEMNRQISEKVKGMETSVRNARFDITSLHPTLVYDVVTSSPGVAFNTDALVSSLVEQWRVLQVPTGLLVKKEVNPDITTEDILLVEKNLEKVIGTEGLALTYTNPLTRWDYEWEIGRTTLSQWLEVQRVDGDLVLGLERGQVEAYLADEVAADVEVEPVDAKFEISPNQKVEAFRGSRPGVTIDIDAVYNDLNEAILQRNWHEEGVVSSVALITKQVEPNIKTSEVNDLGITEILGAGYSNFSGSPTNRVKNVRFAVQEKLNGYLIKPGETFSLLNALKPFTIEGGYLPELVIKGDEIKPEVGGGLCQVGSTMFRAAMNSGMEIVERRNHSLVVSYYNDHRNGLPGTDATIYDSAPDFKFKNITNNHILITTDMNEATGDLWFTLWGTGVGRKGYYTEPVVEQWIPAGARRVTKTTALAPGVWRCQGAHPGAVTSFTYVIENDDGSKEEQVFRSHYRPLPEICLLGATQEEIDAEQNVGTGEIPTDGESVIENSEQEEVVLEE